MQFHHVALNCVDQGVIEEFYTKHFGFNRARGFDIGGGKQIIFLKGPGIHLELFPADFPPSGPARNDGSTQASVIRHFAFKVDDVDAQLAKMGEAVNRVTLGPLAFDGFIPGWKSAWLADPEGNIVEISQGYSD